MRARELKPGDRFAFAAVLDGQVVATVACVVSVHDGGGDCFVTYDVEATGRRGVLVAGAEQELAAAATAGGRR